MKSTLKIKIVACSREPYEKLWYADQIDSVFVVEEYDADNFVMWFSGTRNPFSVGGLIKKRDCAILEVVAGKLAPFDKRKALAGAAVVTTDGRKVTHLTHIPVDLKYSLVGYVEGSAGLDLWDEDGKRYHTGISKSDLFLAPEKSEYETVFLALSPEQLRAFGHKTYKECEEECQENERPVAINFKKA